MASTSGASATPKGALKRVKVPSGVFKTPSNEGKKRRRLQIMKTPSNTSSEGSSEAVPETPGAKERAMLSIPASPCLRKLGYGTGVKVFLYERSPRSGGAARSPWAIKKFSKKSGGHAPDMIAERLDEEAAILRTLKHPNIIGFRGYKKTSDGTRVLAVENGEKALFDMIEDMEDGEVIPACHIEKTIDSIASALHYLHTEKHLLHGDLKSGNVLILGDDKFEAIKLCDFGVTLPLNDKLEVEEKRRLDYVGTGPWCAKEAMDASNGSVSNKTDIFALGCVIFEMLTLRTPHMDLFPDVLEDSDGDILEDTLDDSEYQEALGTRPELPSEVTSGLDERYLRVLSLFYACTEVDPDKRPSAEMVLQALQEEVQVVTKKSDEEEEQGEEEEEEEEESSSGEEEEEEEKKEESDDSDIEVLEEFEKKKDVFQLCKTSNIFRPHRTEPEEEEEEDSSSQDEDEDSEPKKDVSQFCRTELEEDSSSDDDDIQVLN